MRRTHSRLSRHCTGPTMAQAAAAMALTSDEMASFKDRPVAPGAGVALESARVRRRSVAAGGPGGSRPAAAAASATR